MNNQTKLREILSRKEPVALKVTVTCLSIEIGYFKVLYESPSKCFNVEMDMLTKLSMHIVLKNIKCNK